MSAKNQAIQDIKDSLKREGKAFIAFRSELNPVMRRLVNDQLKEQKAWCLSAWSGKEDQL